MSEISKNIENMIELFENMKLKLKENENLKEEVDKLKEENENLKEEVDKLKEENKKLKEENKDFGDILNLIVKNVRVSNQNLLYVLKLYPNNYDGERLKYFCIHYNEILNIINIYVFKPQNETLLKEAYEYRF